MGYDFYTQVWTGIDNQTICDIMMNKKTGFDKFSTKHEQTGKFIWDECCHGMDYYAKTKAYNYYAPVINFVGSELIDGELFINERFNPSLRLIVIPWELNIVCSLDINYPKLAPVYGVGNTLSCGWGILVCGDLERTKKDKKDIYDEAEDYKKLFGRVANEKFDSVEAQIMINNMEVHTATVEI
jgi:hypothetical protein